MENQYAENIKKGMKVEIVTRQSKIAHGIVDDLAARENFHAKGILVRLKSGEIGRVQKILLDDMDKNKKNFEEIKKMIQNGEDLKTEFKSSALWSFDYTNEQIKNSKSYEVHTHKQKASKVIIAKSIAALLNSEGGNLVIGVKENKLENNFDIVGIQDELKKLIDGSIDGYRRMLIDEVLRQYFPAKIYNHINDYIKIEFVDCVSEKQEKKLLCWIRIMRSDVRVFLQLTGKEVFMIRTDTQSRALEGEELVDYCMKRFSK